MSASTKTMKYIVVLPCMGSPYIWKNKVFSTKTKEGKAELGKELKKVVRGNIEAFAQDPSRFARIHPMFVEERERWGVADKLLKLKDARVYVNEEGRDMCCPNMAVIVMHKDFSNLSVISADIIKALPLTVSRVPLFGEIAIVVSVPDLQKVVAPDALKLVNVKEFMTTEEDSDSESDEEDDTMYERWLDGYIYEPDDSDDEEAMHTRARERGWDYLESSGQVFQQKV